MIKPKSKGPPLFVHLYPAAKARLAFLSGEAAGEGNVDPDNIHFVDLKQEKHEAGLSFGADAIIPIDFRWTYDDNQPDTGRYPTMSTHRGISLTFEAFKDNSPYVAPSDILDEDKPPANQYSLVMGVEIEPVIVQELSSGPDTVPSHSVTETDAHFLLPIIRSLRRVPGWSSDFLADKPID